MNFSEKKLQSQIKSNMAINVQISSSQPLTHLQNKNHFEIEMATTTTTKPIEC